MNLKALIIESVFYLLVLGFENLSTIKSFNTRIYGSITDQTCLSIIDNYIAFYYLCPEEHPDIDCFVSTNNVNMSNWKITYHYNNNGMYLTLNDEYNIKINNNDCKYKHEIKAIPYLFTVNTNTKLFDLRKLLLERKENNRENNIIVGSGSYYGLFDVNSTWIETDQDLFDITKRYDLLQALPPNIIDNIISTHVFEHLFPNAFIDAMITLKYLLKSGGGMYISVPDINCHKNAYANNYLENLVSNLIANHRFIWSYDSLKYVYESLGFEVTPIQYFNENHEKVLNEKIIEKMKQFQDLNNILEGAYMHYSVAIYVQKIN